MSAVLLKRSPYVSTEEELAELVSAVEEAGAFCFDVETRGNVERHHEVMERIDAQWQAKLATLKTDHPSVLERSKQVIIDAWKKEVALDPLRNEVFWISIAIDGRSWAIPMGHPNGEVLVPEERGDGSTVPPEGHRKILASGKESMAKAKYHIPAVFTPPPPQLERGVVMSALEPIMMNPDIVKVNQNVGFDAKSVAKYYGGTLPAGRLVDTIVLQHILDENMVEYNLRAIIARQFKGFDPYSETGKVGVTIDTEPFSVACTYSHLDARWPWLAYKRMWRRISAHPGLKRAAIIDMDVQRVASQMELNGTKVNKRALKSVDRELAAEQSRILLALNEYVPPGFNPESNAEKRDLLFNKKRQGGLGLKPVKKTKGGAPSVDKYVLEKLKSEHPAVQLLVDLQTVNTLRNNFTVGLPDFFHSGRVHPSFNLGRTDTGRFSSSKPNLQQIPRDSRIRRLFCADKGESLIVADYDQIELRVMCMFSADPAMSSIFIEATQDIHTATAAAVLGKPWEEVTPDERQVYGKTPNFLMGYGGSAKLLADRASISVERAEKVVEDYKKAFKVLFSWQDEVINHARAHGYVETMAGRRRRLPEIHSSDFYKRSRAERQAVNAVVQGTAAELCKEAMTALQAELPLPKCKILVQVHDELVVSVPTEEVNEWLPKVETIMGNGRVINNIPLRVQGHYAQNWAEAKG